VIAGDASLVQTVIGRRNGCDVLMDEEQLARSIGDVYRGRCMIGHDLDVY
jgi:hypothetical protein